MDKGIRCGTNFKFNEMLSLLPTIGGKAFRRTILDWTVEQYGVTMAASSAHYAYAFRQAKANTPELVEGLGRAEDKKGGRKSVKVTPALSVFVDAESIVQDKFIVRVKKTGAVVVDGVSFEAAQALISKAAAQKKAKLYFA